MASWAWPWPISWCFARAIAGCFRRFGEWKKQKGLVSTQARFTCARLNRKLRSDFPCLSSKGIASKRLSFWLADVAVEWANREEATELDKLVASCAYSYVSFLQMIDEYPCAYKATGSEHIQSRAYPPSDIFQIAKLVIWSCWGPCQQPVFVAAGSQASLHDAWTWYCQAHENQLQAFYFADWGRIHGRYFQNGEAMSQVQCIQKGFATVQSQACLKFATALRAKRLKECYICYVTWWCYHGALVVRGREK